MALGEELVSLTLELSTEREQGGKEPDQCLWPEPYNELTPEAAYKWLTECWWTDNEANQKIQRIPSEPFVMEFCKEWVNAYVNRQPTIFEKSRRIVVSWMARGLETWAMGIQRGTWVIIDQTHKNAAEHLWRIDFSLWELYHRRPELKIPKHESRGAILTKEPTHVILANGSIIMQAHQDAEAAQGKGRSGVTMEEISKYRNPTAFWNQAIIITLGEAGTGGGWVCGIANASPNPDWKRIKGADERGRGGANARELLGFE